MVKCERDISTGVDHWSIQTELHIFPFCFGLFHSFLLFFFASLTDRRPFHRYMYSHPVNLVQSKTRLHMFRSRIQENIKKRFPKIDVRSFAYRSSRSYLMIFFFIYFGWSSILNSFAGRLPLMENSKRMHSDSESIKIVIKNDTP